MELSPRLSVDSLQDTGVPTSSANATVSRTRASANCTANLLPVIYNIKHLAVSIGIRCFQRQKKPEPPDVRCTALTSPQQIDADSFLLFLIAKECKKIFALWIIPFRMLSEARRAMWEELDLTPPTEIESTSSVIINFIMSDNIPPGLGAFFLCFPNLHDFLLRGWPVIVFGFGDGEQMTATTVQNLLSKNYEAKHRVKNSTTEIHCQQRLDCQRCRGWMLVSEAMCPFSSYIGSQLRHVKCKESALYATLRLHFRAYQWYGITTLYGEFSYQSATASTRKCAIRLWQWVRVYCTITTVWYIEALMNPLQYDHIYNWTVTKSLLRKFTFAIRDHVVGIGVWQDVTAHMMAQESRETGSWVETFWSRSRAEVQQLINLSLYSYVV